MLLSAYIPLIPTSVSTAIQDNTVKIAWELPSTNGSPITSYEVYIQESGTTTYTLESSDCDGSLLTVISNRYCNIDYTTLIASPFNFNGGESVYAKVVAINVYGASE